MLAELDDRCWNRFDYQRKKHLQVSLPRAYHVQIQRPQLLLVSLPQVLSDASESCCGLVPTESYGALSDLVLSEFLEK